MFRYLINDAMMLIETQLCLAFTTTTKTVLYFPERSFNTEVVTRLIILSA